jgi:hypothetical protein
MTPAEAREVLRLVEGYWSKLSDAKASAYTSWLTNVTASKEQVEAVVRELAEDLESKFPPTVADIAMQLRYAGLHGETQFGSGRDLRLMAELRKSKSGGGGGLDDMNFTKARLRGISVRDAARDSAEHYREMVREHDSMGYPGPNIWRDWLAASEQALAEQSSGGARV